MKAQRLYLLTLIACLAALLNTACSPDNEEINGLWVKIEVVDTEAYAATISIATNEATRGAWMCIEQGTPLPSAEEVLAKGRSIDTSTTTHYKAEWLVPQSSYTIVAAVANDTEVTSTQAQLATPADNTPTSATNHALIVFMQGDNGLADFMDINLQNIITSYYELPEGAQVVIFYDRGNYTRLTELYMSDGMVKQRLIKEYNRTLSSVDVGFMKGVFELIEQEVQADSYGMILSSHGGGWVPSDIYRHYLQYDWQSLSTRAAHTPTTKFYGQDGSEYMEVATLAEVISTFYYDYIIFDACFMSNVEALYDLRHNADYIIASSAEVLGNGFPYPQMMPLLFRPDHGLQLCCEAYMELFEGSSGTISLVDCSEFDALANAMKQVVAAADDTIDYNQIQGYEGYPIHLYYDLEQHVEQLTDDPALRHQFHTALKNTVVYTNHTPTYFSALYGQQTLDLPRSCGLTCHVEREEFPETHEAYLETAWAQHIGAE